MTEYLTGEMDSLLFRQGCVPYLLDIEIEESVEIGLYKESRCHRGYMVAFTESDR